MVRENADRNNFLDRAGSIFKRNHFYALFCLGSDAQPYTLSIPNRIGAPCHGCLPNTPSVFQSQATSAAQVTVAVFIFDTAAEPLIVCFSHLLRANQQLTVDSLVPENAE